MKSLFKSFRASHQPQPTGTPQQPITDDRSAMAKCNLSEGSSHPIAVIELFQSQGCNSCPPANANVIDLSCEAAPRMASLPSNPGVDHILLTYHVTYWDSLGWKDTFGNRAFDERQRDYVKRMGLRSAFTPQVIVNGRSSGVGSSRSDLAKALKEGDAGRKLPVRVSALKGDADIMVSVSAPSTSENRHFDVLIAWYDPNAKDVRIQHGENAGRTLPHLNVVNHVQRIGDVMSGKEAVFVLDRNASNLRGVVLVQEGPGGWILGAERI